MTYGDLLDRLEAMSYTQLNMDVTIYVRGVDEFYPLSNQAPVMISDANIHDQLDPNHPFLVV